VNVEQFRICKNRVPTFGDIPYRKAQCFGSGFNQVSGFGIRIRIKEGKNDPLKRKN